MAKFCKSCGKPLDPNGRCPGCGYQGAVARSDREVKGKKRKGAGKEPVSVFKVILAVLLAVLVLLLGWLVVDRIMGVRGPSTTETVKVTKKTIESAIEDFLDDNEDLAGPYTEYSYEVTHDPDNKKNTDTVRISLTVVYSNTTAVYSCKATYQYSEADNTWEIIRGGDWKPQQFDQPEIPSSNQESPGDSQSSKKTKEQHLSYEYTLLCSGEDDDGTEWELVADETSTYSGNTVYLGVIKDNEWYIELTSECPLLYSTYDSTQVLVGRTIEEVEDETEFQYLSNGVFCRFERTHRDIGTVTRPDWTFVFWNTENNQSYQKQVFGSSWGGDYRSCLEGLEKVLLVTREPRQEYLWAGYTHYNYHYSWEVFDPKTGNSTIIKSYDDDDNSTANESYYYPDTYSQIYDGVFYVRWNSLEAYYTENGELLLDLNELFEQNGSRVISVGSFNNGTANIIVENSTGTRFRLTIDKSGTVLSEIQTDSRSLDWDDYYPDPSRP